MDESYIQKNNVVERYVLNQLTEEELVEFELYYFEHPALLDDVAIARALAEQLSVEADFNKVEPQEVEMASPIDLVSSWFRLPWVLVGNFAIMATLAIMLVTTSDPSSQGVYSADRVWVGQVRGGTEPITIQLRAASLILEIDVPDSGLYDVELRDSAGALISDLAMNALDAQLLMVIDSSLLRAERYKLSVVAADGRSVVDKELLILP